tara:strand:+ start:1807 stop:2220 length:414 start_codon:yes stop_codon:yes gene_type:complete
MSTSTTSPYRVRFTPQELARLKAAAAAIEMTVGDFIRGSLHRQSELNVTYGMNHDLVDVLGQEEPTALTSVRLLPRERELARAMSFDAAVSIGGILRESALRELESGSFDDRGARCVPGYSTLTLRPRSWGIGRRMR